LLPFTDDGAVDWPGFEAHVARTLAAGLAPAVNMDTGYVNLLDDATRREVLARTQAIAAGREFVAGAFVADQPGAAFDRDAYARQIELIQQAGGTPVIFQSFGLTGQPSGGHHRRIRQHRRRCADRFIAFELGTMFAPFGKIYDLATYGGLLGVPQCIGAKHSSLSRVLEWERLHPARCAAPRLQGLHRQRPRHRHGDVRQRLPARSEHLCARPLCAARCAVGAGDPGFYELNDALQYLGFFAFRRPVPAYKHSAAQFLKLRGWIASDAPHPRAERRPESDVAILRELGERLGVVNA
jgi:hypothetical protein